MPKSTNILTPEEVFTPRTIVTRDMFERRNEPDMDGNPGVQDRLVDALRDRGGQVLIYGDTGVGKSSLIKYAAEDEELNMVTVECTEETDYAGIIDSVVQQLLDVREIKYTENTSYGAEASAEVSIPWFSRVSGKIKGTKGKSSDYEVIQKPALDVAMELMSKTGASLLVLDNFQNIFSESTRKLVSQLLERLSDRASRNLVGSEIKCVVIGIADDATSVLGTSRSYLRRTAQIGVPRMPDEEIRALLTRGFKLLNINVPNEIMDDFVFYSDGFPYFAHIIGLNVSRLALRSNIDRVGENELQSALTEAARSVSASYKNRIDLALENGGKVRPRTQIINFLAKDSKRIWSGNEVQQLWDDNVGPRDDFSSIHVALGQLTTEKHGQILKRTGKKKSYRYQFTDPHIRPFIRITHTKNIR